MRKIVLSTILLILFSIPSLAGQYPVVRVVDGDTIVIMYEGKKERIRMLCVDTPESVHPDQSRNTPMGRKASTYTKNRLTGKKVELEFETRRRGNYGRLLAYVILDGDNFNIELVREGWSPYYTKYGESQEHHFEFLAAENAAKAKRLRIWQSLPEEGTGIYHGNFKSRVFHQPECRYYNCKSCVKVFDTRQDALHAGYRPCGICNP